MTVCIVVNGEKFQSRADLNLNQTTCPSYFHILQYVQVSNGLNHYFFCLILYTDTHTDRQTHIQTDRHTDRHEYFIVAVDKPQNYKNL